MTLFIPRVRAFVVFSWIRISNMANPALDCSLISFCNETQEVEKWYLCSRLLCIPPWDDNLNSLQDSIL